jgi:hypothetical protein
MPVHGAEDEDGERREESRSPSTEYEFDEEVEESPERQEEPTVSQQDEEGLFVPDEDGVDMAAALAWDTDDEEDEGVGG